MISMVPELKKDIKRPVYLQLYDYIKKSITDGTVTADEKLPSLRNMAKSLDISITTVSQAYNQLLVEGYIDSRSSSGYYVRDIGMSPIEPSDSSDSFDLTSYSSSPELLYDLSCFDFTKWKKCSNRIYTYYPHLLLSEGDPQGEYELRQEISRYIYSSRGVNARPEQIVIGAGTQQITSQLSVILSKVGIGHIALETPGYNPVHSIFEERGFAITSVPVMENGVSIELLPRNIKCAVYVNPSNQFPTGAMMPVDRRHELLLWAEKNQSYIIEDDYDSELRYFGRPVPAMQGMDKSGRVIYLGSFSSTLYPSIKISYMILPGNLCAPFESMKKYYTQTCSKAEQLTLSLFMHDGLYQTNIRKLRTLYARKLSKITALLNTSEVLHARNTSSGINMILDITCEKSAQEISSKALSGGLNVTPLGSKSVILYYNQIPEDKLSYAVSLLSGICRS